MSLHTREATQEVVLIEICLVLLAYIRPIFRGKSDALFSRLTICLPLWWFYLSSVWGVITVKNKSLIMISTISVMLLCYSNVTSQYAIWSSCYDIMLSHLTILLLQCADLSLYLGVRLLYFAILPLHFSILPFRH